MQQTGVVPFLLYVDDDPDDLELVFETVKSVDPSLKVHTFSNGNNAFAFLEAIPNGNILPAVIILDMNMPGLSGKEVLKRLKQDPAYKQIPVYIFTNSDHPKHREECLALGAKDFITKPYRNSDLITVCAFFAGNAHNAPLVKPN